MTRNIPQKKSTHDGAQNVPTLKKATYDFISDLVSGIYTLEQIKERHGFDKIRSVYKKIRRLKDYDIIYRDGKYYGLTPFGTKFLFINRGVARHGALSLEPGLAPIDVHDFQLKVRIAPKSKPKNWPKVAERLILMRKPEYSVSRLKHNPIYIVPMGEWGLRYLRITSEHIIVEFPRKDWPSTEAHMKDATETLERVVPMIEKWFGIRLEGDAALMVTVPRRHIAYTAHPYAVWIHDHNERTGEKWEIHVYDEEGREVLFTDESKGPQLESKLPDLNADLMEKIERNLYEVWKGHSMQANSQLAIGAQKMAGEAEERARNAERDISGMGETLEALGASQERTEKALGSGMERLEKSLGAWGRELKGNLGTQAAGLDALRGIVLQQARNVTTETQARKELAVEVERIAAHLGNFFNHYTEAQDLNNKTLNYLLNKELKREARKPSELLKRFFKKMFKKKTF